MAKIRVHELAKELQLDSKQVISMLAKHNIEGKKPQSSLEDDQAALVRRALSARPSAPAGKPGAEEKKTGGQAEKTAAPVRKKKLLAVFHPQNATSKEARNFHSRQQNAARGQSRQGERAETEPAKAPLVKKPRPHPVERNIDLQNPGRTSIPRYQETRRTPDQTDTKAKTNDTDPAVGAEKTIQTEQNINQTAGAQENRKAQNRPAAGSPSEKPAAEKVDNRTVAERLQARQAAQGKATHTISAREIAERASRLGGNRPSADRGGQRGSRPYSGDRTGQGQRTGDRAGRPYSGDRTGQQRTGDRTGRPYSGDRTGQQSPRSGDRPNRPYSGDRTGNRTGFAGNRPGFAGNRPGFGSRGPVQDKDKDEENGRRFESRSRNAKPSKAAAPGMDMGLKKPARDIGHKTKDKEKDSLRGNKSVADRGPGRGTSNRHLIPKALQKPVHRQKEEKKEVVTEIRLPEKLTVKELAEAMKMQPSVIVKKLFMEGEMVTVNQEIDFEKAQEIALSYEIIAEPEEKVDVIAELLAEDEEKETDMEARSPVVCVMGHVDHGKTSLLDSIRDAHVTSKEAGGITQNIGAYSVRINGKRITFLDTPGHEAFTAMRMRGANSTDIAVLVVAADDGVMPQTVEAISHAKAAGVEIIVAVNKIDKPSANIDKVKQELTEYELISTDWGGSTEFVPVSAKTGQGIDDLLETILLTAEIMELKANPNRKARGLVLEAKLDKGKGPVANVLIQKGTLREGDYIACGAASGKVRAMMDEHSKRLKVAGPSTPVEILGLNDVPNAGEILVALDSDKDAKSFAATFISEGRNKLLEETKSRMSLDDLFSQMKTGNLKELEIIVKADVQGSVEALKQSLIKLSNDEVAIRIIHGGVGAINESDISLAAASNAIVIGFNVRPDATAKAIADQEKVDLRLYRVIYQAIDDIEAAMKGMLEPIYEEKVIGHAEVRQLFRASGIGTIAGSYVLDGSVQRDCKVKITRGEELVFDGKLGSLKRFKDDVKEVKAGYECGLVFEGFSEVQEGDQVEASIMVEVPRT